MTNYKKLSDHISSVVSGIVEEVTGDSNHGWTADFKYRNNDFNNLIVAFQVIPKPPPPLPDLPDDADQTARDKRTEDEKQRQKDIEAQQVPLSEVYTCLSQLPNHKFTYCITDKWAFVARSKAQLITITLSLIHI